MQVVVGRIGRAHGIRGEVGVEVRTDEPDRRFTSGAVLVTDTAPARSLTIAGLRWHGERLLVKFAEVPDRTAAEGLRNVFVLADVPDGSRPEDPEEFYDRDLVGLSVRTAVSAEPVGTVAAVVHLPSQDLLEISRPGGARVLVPLVAELVPEVSLDGGYVVVTDRPGLLDPEAADSAEVAASAEVAGSAGAADSAEVPE